MSYTPTIGLEVHAELKTFSKMFCGCKNEPHMSEPNSNICPVCTGHPGTLPVPNQKAIEMVLMFGHAVGAKVADYSEFDRKNYFYPDIPKAYQISQYAFPFLTGGELEKISLTRVHLEEDTARSQHDKGDDSLVDFNRAGVPLMELVTEPVIHDSKTAGNFAKELQLLLRTLKISDANMEMGEMRVEANISISKNSKELGTKVEVKNLNSFKSVVSAIEHEIRRQEELLERGDEVKQETRGWDENKGMTFSQRSKETAKDYRYFPDPDIPKMNIPKFGPFDKTRLAEKMPELPSNLRNRYKNLGLASLQIETILANKSLAFFFDDLISSNALTGTMVTLAANYLTSDILSVINDTNLTLGEIKREHFIELIDLLDSNKIGSRVAKDLVLELFNSQLSPLQIATERNLLQLSDDNSLKPIIEEIIISNPNVVAEFKSGKEVVMQFLVGQGMKMTKGSADPEALRKLLLEALK